MAKQRTTDRETGVPADDTALALKTSVRRSTVPANDNGLALKAGVRRSTSPADAQHSARASVRPPASRADAERPARASVHPPASPADADALAFRAAVRDVKPLAQTPARTSPELSKPRAHRKPFFRQDDSHGVGPLDMPLIEAGDELPAISGGDALTFQRPGVRNQVLRKLRRGLYPLEDELDLHGLSQSAARDQLAAFLAHNRDAGRRCVRIIHGKGYRSGARGPVLKIAVDLWLRRHTDVMAFTSARAIDGGTGAVYVLLRA